jgi:translocation protein SEC62
MHPQQVFVDGAEVYVWIYDPIPMHYWLFGALLVVGAIVICLFPLWPPSLRKGVYYLSIAAAGFLVFILGLAVLRFIVFCVVWLVTGSKHHFWLFPNLTEDVGFFASFWPLYTHEYKDGSSLSKKTKKRKRDKDSDAEDDSNAPLLDKDKIDNIKENETGTISDRGDDATEDASTSTASTVHKRNVTKSTDADDVQTIKSEIPGKITTETNTNATTAERKDSITPSESESEGSQRSSTGKDFEMVDPADVDNP